MNSNDKLLRLPEVLETVGLGRTAWLDRVKAKTAPQPAKIGRATVWSCNEVQAWMRGRRGQQPAAGISPAALAPSTVDAVLHRDPITGRQRLLPLKDCDDKTLEDALYTAAINVEDALLTAHATPGRDYTLLDLYRMAVPIAVEMMRQEAVDSWRVPSAA